MAGVKDIKIELNDAGIQELLKSAPVEAFLRGKAEAVEVVAQSGGGEFTSEIIEGTKRSRAVIRTADYKARKAESENQTLSRAGHSVGGSPGKG
jgi:hypothetical protein